MKAKFGRYVFLKKIATGGMAEIFLARRLSYGGFSKFVVIKRLLPQHAGKRAYERLFLAEARTGALLNHPNIVALYDLGKLDDAFFMAMEHVDGVSVAEMMARTASQLIPVPVGVAIRVACGVAHALQYAHHALDLNGEKLRIIHHDVSPQNIQVSFEGDVKLLDFGVATRMGKRAAGGRRGKFGYMSPEAMRREELDPRSDLYSLGVVLYELTCGRRLFKGADAENPELRDDIPHPTRVDPYYPASLEEVVLKALAPAPGERYADMQSLVHDLTAVARRLGCDVGPEALARHLDEAFGSEIAERRAQLAELARASAPRRRPRKGAEPTQSSEPKPGPEVAADDPMASAEAVAEEEPPEVRFGDWAEVPLTPPPPPESAIPDGCEAEPSGEFDAQGDDPSGEFVVPADVLGQEADWGAALAAPVRALRRGAYTVAGLGVLLALCALFAGRYWGQRAAEARLAPGLGSLVVESDPPGARVFNGEALMGMTPFEAPPAPVGTLYRLRLTLAGYEPWERRVALEAARRHQTVNVVLRPRAPTRPDPTSLRAEAAVPAPGDSGVRDGPPPPTEPAHATAPPDAGAAAPVHPRPR